MERLDKIAKHDGTITAVADGCVTVTIASTSACASCEAHAKCGFAESKNKSLAIRTADWERYAVGEKVEVSIDQRRGMQAVWVAYVFPAVLVLAAVLLLSVSGAAEWIVALAALAVLGAYVGVLILIRGKLEKQFTTTITKTESIKP